MAAEHDYDGRREEMELVGKWGGLDYTSEVFMPLHCIVLCGNNNTSHCLRHTTPQTTLLASLE